MKENYEQIRAKNALAAVDFFQKNYKDAFKGSGGGEAVAKKIATMIIDNGFIGAMAFAIENRYKNGKNGYYHVFKAVLMHLESIKMNFGIDCSDLEPFLKGLCEKEAGVLRAITAETMAYMSYLRRFAKPENQGQ